MSRQYRKGPCCQCGVIDSRYWYPKEKGKPFEDEVLCRNCGLWREMYSDNPVRPQEKEDIWASARRIRAGKSRSGISESCLRYDDNLAVHHPTGQQICQAEV